MKFAFAIAGTAYAAETPAAGEAHGAAPAEGAAHGAETHAGSEAGHGDAGHGGVFPPFDPSHFASQLLWLAITFGIFYYIMSKVALPRIGSIIETRRDRISNDLDEAHRMKDEADAAHAAYEHELAAARKKANGIAQGARDEAKAEAEAERRRIEASLEARMAEAETKIAGIKSQALSEVGRIASDATETIVTELLGAKVTKAEIAAALGRE